MLLTSGSFIGEKAELALWSCFLGGEKVVNALYSFIFRGEKAELYSSVLLGENADIALDSCSLLLLFDDPAFGLGNDNRFNYVLRRSRGERPYKESCSLLIFLFVSLDIVKPSGLDKKPRSSSNFTLAFNGSITPPPFSSGKFIGYRISWNIVKAP